MPRSCARMFVASKDLHWWCILQVFRINVKVTFPDKADDSTLVQQLFIRSG